MPLKYCTYECVGHDRSGYQGFCGYCADEAMRAIIVEDFNDRLAITLDDMKFNLRTPLSAEVREAMIARIMARAREFGLQIRHGEKETDDAA